LKGTTTEEEDVVAPVAVELVEDRVGESATESSSGAWDVATLKVACGPFKSWDSTGMMECNNFIGLMTNGATGAMAQYRCTPDYETEVYWSEGVDGICGKTNLFSLNLFKQQTSLPNWPRRCFFFCQLCKCKF
jgi:hypothetical protein